MTNDSTSSADETDQRTTPLLQNDALHTQSSHQYIPESYRWVVLAAFSFANMSNAVLWVTFAPIAPLAESFYGVSDTYINAFSVSYLLAYIPGSIMAFMVYSFPQNGLRRGIVVAALLSAVGAFVRYFASINHPIYGLVLMGQYLAAISQPFLTNVPPKIAAAWFPASERDVATVLASMANPVGIAIGSILPAVFVNEQDDGKVIGMDTLLLVEALLATVGAIVAAFFVKSRPVSPPSAAAEKEAMECNNDNDDEPILQVLSTPPSAAAEKESMECTNDNDDEPILQVLSRNIMVCLRNRHFLVLFVAFGIGLGIFNAMTTLTEQLIAPFCYTDDDASLFAGLLLGCGLLSAGLVGIYLDKTHRYQFMLKLLFTLATATLLLYAVALRPNARAGLAIIFSILGATMLPILPTALEAAVECTYPVPEEYSTGLLMSAGMVTGVCFIFGLQRLADAQPPCDNNHDGGYYLSWPSIVLGVSGTVAAMAVFQFRGPLLRLQAEQEIDHDGDEVGGERVVDEPLLR